MPDRDKVIKGLQESAAYFRSSFDAMYGTVACEKFRNWTDAIEQAIALLKAQEAIKPIERNGFYYCGACRYAFTVHRQKYCTDCGRAVKWE